MKQNKKSAEIFSPNSVTNGGGEAKMESGHTFLRFFLDAFPYSLSELITTVFLEQPKALASSANNRGCCYLRNDDTVRMK